MNSENPREGLPNFISSWAQLYWFVIGNLVAVMAFLYWLTKTFE